MSKLTEGAVSSVDCRSTMVRRMTPASLRAKLMRRSDMRNILAPMKIFR